MDNSNKAIAAHWELNRQIIDALGWQVTKLDTPEVYSGKDEAGKDFRIECWWTLVDGKGEAVMSAWQTPDLVWEHAPIPDYCDDLNLAWALFAELPAAYTPRLVRIITSAGSDGGFIYSTKAAVMSNETHDEDTAVFTSPATAICKAWLIWHEMNSSAAT